jgi:hypothetical protein
MLRNSHDRQISLKNETSQVNSETDLRRYISLSFSFLSLHNAITHISESERKSRRDERAREREPKNSLMYDPVTKKVTIHLWSIT